MRLESLNLKGHNIPVTYPDHFTDLPAVWQAFGIDTQRPVVVITGGAGGMSDEDIEKIQSFFEQHLIPFILEQKAGVVEGGTDSGVMAAISRARNSTGADFPLIGVAAREIENLPDYLEANHTHFILCPGNDWGDESEWIAAAASALAGIAPSITLLLNGGRIAWNDAAFSLKYKRPVLVAEGSGRTADTLARTSQWKALDLRAVRLLRTGMIHIANPFKTPDGFMKKLSTLLKT